MSRATASVLALACVVALGAGCQKAPPADVAATVNDRPISYADLDKQIRLQFGEEALKGNDDQARRMRLEVLGSLITREIMLQRAEKQSLMASDSEVEARLNELKAPYTQEEFQRQLATRKMTADELKDQIRRDMSVQKLINKEITSKISISDRDIADFYAKNRPSFNLAEPQLRIAHILVTPGADQNASNLQGNNAQNDAQAREKINMIESRLKQGADFNMLAHNFSEDPNTAPNGGDLGFVPESAFQQAPPELRRLVLSLAPGQVSSVIRTQEGYRVVKLLSREPAGQRELNDPRVQQSIRETLINMKDQLLKTAYDEVARNDAKVVNYYAQRVVENR